jgi:hypothetical protein
MIYGILLESCRDGVCEVYGVATWKRIVQELNFEHESFTTLGRYDESIIERVAECKINLLFKSILLFSLKVWLKFYMKVDRIYTCNFLANAL